MNRPYFVNGLFYWPLNKVPGLFLTNPVYSLKREPLAVSVSKFQLKIPMYRCPNERKTLESGSNLRHLFGVMCVCVISLTVGAVSCGCGCVVVLFCAELFS